MYPDLVKPFKRYQIAPVWRAERPQKGRYREFYQCDADIVGTSSMLADAEIIAVIYSILKELAFKQFVIKINNRKILTAIGEYSGVPPTLLSGLYRSIDKLDKLGLAGVREEMVKHEIPAAVAAKMLDLISIPGADLAALRERIGQIPKARAGIEELEQLSEFLRDMNIAAENIEIDFRMVRGLEYYTGPIFETVVMEPKIGSLTGGGRYDELIGLFNNKSLPATGTTIGIERIIDVMEELEMFPTNLRATVTEVLVTVFDAERRAESIRVTTALRAAGINTEEWLDIDALGKQLKYAASKGIPFAVIIGPDEAAAGNVTLRDLTTGEQAVLSRANLVEELKKRLKAK
jgi:histidyl-tRNA synthetase